MVRAGKEFVLQARMNKVDYDMTGQVEQSEESETAEDYHVSDVEDFVCSDDHKVQFSDAVCQSKGDEASNDAHGRGLFGWNKVVNWAGKLIKCLKTKLSRLFHMLC